MVHPREPHHFEGEGFYAEVSHVPKCDGQIDLPEGERLDSRYDPVDGAKPCSSSPQAYG
jgi:hypothetical protein